MLQLADGAAAALSSQLTENHRDLLGGRKKGSEGK